LAEHARSANAPFLIAPTLTVTPEANRVLYSPFPFSHVMSSAWHLGRPGAGHSNSPAINIDLDEWRNHNFEASHVTRMHRLPEDGKGDIAM
jgi:hypothetical protein